MKKGDTVSAIDEPITGTIISVDGTTVLIETEDGFPMNFQKNELIAVEGKLITILNMDKLNECASI